MTQAFQMGVTKIWPDWFLELVSEDDIITNAQYNNVVYGCMVKTTKEGSQMAVCGDWVIMMPCGELRLSRNVTPFRPDHYRDINSKSTGED